MKFVWMAAYLTEQVDGDGGGHDLALLDVRVDHVRKVRTTSQAEATGQRKA